MSEQIFCVGSFSMTTMKMSLEDCAGSVSLAFLMSSLIYLAAGLIFRNVNLIVRTMEGKIESSGGPTPFQDSVIRKVRDIGVFTIFIPIYALIMSAVIRAFYPTAECGTDLTPILFGIIIICLSLIFKYGKSLQETEDGLI